MALLTYVVTATPADPALHVHLDSGTEGSNMAPSSVDADGWVVGSFDYWSNPMPGGETRALAVQQYAFPGVTDLPFAPAMDTVPGTYVSVLARDLTFDLSAIPVEVLQNLTAIDFTIHYHSLACNPEAKGGYAGTMYTTLAWEADQADENLDNGPVAVGSTDRQWHLERTTFRPVYRFGLAGPNAYYSVYHGFDPTVSYEMSDLIGQFNGDVGTDLYNAVGTAALAAATFPMQFGLAWFAIETISPVAGIFGPPAAMDLAGALDSVDLTLWYNDGGGGGGDDGGGGGGFAANPFNHQDRYGRLHRTGKLDNAVGYWRSDFAVPLPGWAIAGVAVTSPSTDQTDSNPRVFLDENDILNLSYSRHDESVDPATDTIHLSTSSDDGATWNAAIDMDIPGIHPTVGNDDKGTRILAGYVANADQDANPGGVLQARLREAGDTDWSDVYTFADATGAAMNAADDTFHLSRGKEPGDRWVLTVVMQADGFASEWAGTDGRTWERLN